MLSTVALLSVAPALFADTLFQGTLTSGQEVPPSVSSGTGFGTVLLNSAEDQITVNLSWTGLTSPAAVAHIHGPAPVGVNAAVLFPFAGVPAATTGSIPQQSFAIDSTELGWLQSGLLYFNVHSTNYPGGEIRGQIGSAAVPEPGSALLIAAAFLIAVPFLRRRRLAR